MMRINKYLCECGLCSRRGADRLLAEGRVLLNGEIPDMGSQVGEGDQVLVDGRPVCIRGKKSYYKFYKPVGVVCTLERREKNSLRHFLNLSGRMTYAGRLDKLSEGLLLLTDDGDLIHEMMLSRHGHEKEYLVEVSRRLTEDFLDRMAKGVYLRELDVTTLPCRVYRVSDKSFGIILTQGLNRQIRRMCGELGYRVRSLKRIRVVNILLDDMREGEVRELTSRELADLLAIKEGKKEWQKKV